MLGIGEINAGGGGGEVNFAGGKKENGTGQSEFLAVLLEPSESSE